MKRLKFSEEQITFALRQSEASTPVADVCRQLGVSEATFYVWKKKYAHLGVVELRELRQLRGENARLKWLVADLTLDKQILTDVFKERSEAAATSGAVAVDLRTVWHSGAAGLCVGMLFTGGMVSAHSGQGPESTADPDPRGRAEPSAVWLPADLGDAAARELGHQSQTGTSAVSPEWAAVAHAHAVAQTHVPASRRGAQGQHPA